MKLVNKSGYELPSDWLAEVLAAPIGTVETIITTEPFRDEPHLYCYWSGTNGELIDYILGPYCDGLQETA
jgi:hypothetical protein